MRRFVTPAAFVFGLCLLASLAIHLPIYGALGALADLLKIGEGEQAPTPVEITFESTEPSTPAEPEPIALAQPMPAEVAPQPERPQRERQREQHTEETPREQPREEQPEPQEVPAPEVPPPEQQPQPQMNNPQAVTQHAQNETNPEHADFIAEHANSVEEQTVAELRNYQEDAPEPTAGAPREGPTQDDGNEDTDELADMRELEGSEQRTATEQEARRDRPRQSPDRMPTTQAQGDTADVGRTQESEGEQRVATAGEQGGAQAQGGGVRTELRTIHDATGTFVVSVPVRPEGAGEGAEGGLASLGVGRGNLGAGERAGREGEAREGQRGRGRGAGSEGPNLRVSWAAAEEVFGEEELEAEREAYAMERRTKNRGSSRGGQDWQEFRAAIENFVPNVRPGNQTALNTAASPFADYLANVHRRIHRQFADRFIGGLPAGSLSPFADMTLMTKLEIIMNRDGTVHRVGVVHTSGFLPFDYGAYNSVMRGQPYPEAPSSILSGDGRVYIHWAFYRNERQCGTFNAEPYILRNPPSSTPSRSTNTGPRDEPEWGGVVPRNATPTWGTDGEHRGEDTTGEGETPEAPAPNPQQNGNGTRGLPPPRRQETIVPTGEAGPIG